MRSTLHPVIPTRCVLRRAARPAGAARPGRSDAGRRDHDRRHGFPGRRRDDRGQSTVLAAMLVALAVVTLVALGPVGRALGARTQARTAADAAALAGAVEGEEAARRLADANGADLVGFERRDGDVVVEVRVDGVEAWSSARATRLAPPVAGAGRPDTAAGTDTDTAAGGAGQAAGAAVAGGGDRAGLAPAMLAALARADQLLGEVVPVASGLRTRAEQQALWDRRHVNPYPVARPGTSDHESGLAIDVPRRFVPRLLPVAAAAGLCQPLPETDPVHFVVCGT